MVPYGTISSTKTKENKMTTYGKTITNETIQFQATDFEKRFTCLGDWFQRSDQEISEYYTDGEITLEAIARFLVDNAQWKCHDRVLLPVGTIVEYRITRARFWDNDGGTDDVTNMGKIAITRTPSDEFNIEFTITL
jgi:hypothetical protein